MIILEGFDGAGKSTLASRLSKKFNLVSYHAGGKPLSEIHKNECIRVQRAISDFPVIHDRVTCVSTFCYEMLMSKPDGHDMVYHAKRLLDYNPNTIYVYCRHEEKYEQAHEIKDYDSNEHLAYIAANRKRIIEHYDMMYRFLKSEFGRQCVNIDAKNDQDVELLELMIPNFCY